MISMQIPPRLTSAGKEVDLAPTSFGELADNTTMLDDAVALRSHMREEGYLLLRGLLNSGEVQVARLSMLDRLAEQGHIDLTSPLNEAKAAPSTRVAFTPDVARKNPLVHQVVYKGALMEFLSRFLGGPIRHFDFTWLIGGPQGSGVESAANIFSNLDIHIGACINETLLYISISVE